MPVNIGCSGFLYDHWRRRFYPPSERTHELEFYAARFDTVELNVTFYRMPPAATFQSWASRVPEGFVFAVKASRYISHILRLHDTGSSVRLLLDRAVELGPHLGPILLQLPPDLPVDLDALEQTLDAFPRDIRVAVEPRHRSWFSEELRSLLTERGVALCVADRYGPVTPQWQTADWTYLRFHAGRATPRSCYGELALKNWVKRLEAGWGKNPTAFVYFNNDHHGCALHDAVTFARLLQAEGVAVSRIPQVPENVLLDQ
jgi:uncharacterized protein YecE (DUF72 family)